VEDAGYVAPAKGAIKVAVAKDSQRLQLLKPFTPITNDELKDMRVLIKAKGKCTTDHISMAGPWLKFRGHLENIPTTATSGLKTSSTESATRYITWTRAITWRCRPVPVITRKRNRNHHFRGRDLGEGSSREHAAMEPRYLGVKAVVVKSFARIHQTNLKKQGMLALTFANPADYDKVRQDDRVTLLGFESFAPANRCKSVWIMPMALARNIRGEPLL
jgi:aconitate hydratase